MGTKAGKSVSTTVQRKKPKRSIKVSDYFHNKGLNQFIIVTNVFFPK